MQVRNVKGDWRKLNMCLDAGNRTQNLGNQIDPVLAFSHICRVVAF